MCQVRGALRISRHSSLIQGAPTTRPHCTSVFQALARFILCSPGRTQAWPRTWKVLQKCLWVKTCPPKGERCSLCS